MRLGLKHELIGIIILGYVNNLSINLTTHKVRTREQLLPILLENKVTLTRQHSLIELSHPINNHGITRHLFTRRQEHDIIQDNILRINRSHLAITHHTDLILIHEIELINHATGTQLCHHPRKGIKHNDSEEKEIRPSLNSNQGHKNSKIEHIKGVKDITPKNLPVAGASFCFKMICFTGIYPPLDLHLRQAL